MIVLTFADSVVPNGLSVKQAVDGNTVADLSNTLSRYLNRSVVVTMDDGFSLHATVVVENTTYQATVSWVRHIAACGAVDDLSQRECNQLQHKELELKLSMLQQEWNQATDKLMAMDAADVNKQHLLNWRTSVFDAILSVKRLIRENG